MTFPVLRNKVKLSGLHLLTSAVLWHLSVESSSQMEIMTAPACLESCGTDHMRGHTVHDWQCCLWLSLLFSWLKLLMSSGPLRLEGTLSGTHLKNWWMYLHKIWKSDELGSRLDNLLWKLRNQTSTETYMKGSLPVWSQALGPPAGKAEF